MIKIKKHKNPPSFFRDWLLQNSDSKTIKKLTSSFSKYFDKCAFCESKSNEEELYINYYRPINGARNTIDGERLIYHYQWLDTSWDNIIIICQTCSRLKSNRFPIDGPPAPIGASIEELKKEKRLLLNPFLDYPEKHFKYLENGEIISNSKKGNITIEILNLNRRTLLDRRFKEKNKLLEICDYFKEHRNLNIFNELLNQLKSYSSMAGYKRFLTTQLIENDELPYLENLSYEEKDYLALSPDYKWPKKKHKVQNNQSYSNQYMILKEKYEVQNNQSYSNEYMILEEKNITSYSFAQYFYNKQRYIENVSINNFRGIESMDIDFNSSKSTKAPWLMFLGENGFGKSSILQAITLTLMGEQARNELQLKATDFLSHAATDGSISIKLTGEKKPIELRMTKNKEEFEQNSVTPKILILSYGSTRLLPQVNQLQKNNRHWSRVENLFNPFSALLDVEAYLLSLNKNDFGKMTEAIESLFFEDVEVNRRLEKLDFLFIDRNESMSLNDLSDGYRNIIALAADIMMVMKTRWNSLDAEGIVLIDELDAHLHPRWNIEIVTRLRKTFPMIQFIVTTHNPLTLRGLERGEIGLLYQDDNYRSQIKIQDLDQNNLMIEQMLTSNLFGLNSTSPITNQLLDEYYLLLSNPEPNPEENKKIDSLKDELSNAGMMGATERDHLFYEAIDIFLAKKKQQYSEIDHKEFKTKILKVIESLERKYLK